MAAQGQAYKRLMQALQNGDIAEAEKWATEFQLDLVAQGLGYVAVEFKAWWDDATAEIWLEHDREVSERSGTPPTDSRPYGSPPVSDDPPDGYLSRCDRN